MHSKIRELLRLPVRGDAERRDCEGSEPVAPEDFVRMKEWIRQAHADAELARRLEDAFADELEDS